MEDKLVTLAIHTFEKAQILKTILETEGIEVYIHNVNQIQPVVSAGVRVRIKESDLPHALRIIEDSKWPKARSEWKPFVPVIFLLGTGDWGLFQCRCGSNDHACLFQPIFSFGNSDGRHVGLPGK